jgi:hypothetical protein
MQIFKLTNTSRFCALPGHRVHRASSWSRCPISKQIRLRGTFEDEAECVRSPDVRDCRQSMREEWAFKVISMYQDAIREQLY